MTNTVDIESYQEQEEQSPDAREQRRSAPLSYYASPCIRAEQRCSLWGGMHTYGVILCISWPCLYSAFENMYDRTVYMHRYVLCMAYICWSWLWLYLSYTSFYVCLCVHVRTKKRLIAVKYSFCMNANIHVHIYAKWDVQWNGDDCQTGPPMSCAHYYWYWYADITDHNFKQSKHCMSNIDMWTWSRLEIPGQRGEIFGNSCHLSCTRRFPHFFLKACEFLLLLLCASWSW